MKKPSIISTDKLNALLRLHILPINQVVYLGSYSLTGKQGSNLVAGFPLRCIQRLSLPDIATQQCRWHDNWNTRGQSTPVLSY